MKKPMNKPMKSAGLCLKEDDMMKFCILDTYLQQKLEIAEMHCNNYVSGNSTGTVHVIPPPPF